MEPKWRQMFKKPADNPRRSTSDDRGRVLVSVAEIVKAKQDEMRPQLVKAANQAAKAEKKPNQAANRQKRPNQEAKPTRSTKPKTTQNQQPAHILSESFIYEPMGLPMALGALPPPPKDPGTQISSSLINMPEIMSSIDAVLITPTTTHANSNTYTRESTTVYIDPTVYANQSTTAQQSTSGQQQTYGNYATYENQSYGTQLTYGSQLTYNNQPIYVNQQTYVHQPPIAHSSVYVDQPHYDHQSYGDQPKYVADPLYVNQVNPAPYVEQPNQSTFAQQANQSTFVQQANQSTFVDQAGPSGYKKQQKPQHVVQYTSKQELTVVYHDYEKIDNKKGTKMSAANNPNLHTKEEWDLLKQRMNLLEEQVVLIRQKRASMEQKSLEFEKQRCKLEVQRHLVMQADKELLESLIYRHEILLNSILGALGRGPSLENGTTM